MKKKSSKRFRKLLEICKDKNIETIENAIKKSDIVFICVGTPTNKKNNSANLKYVYQVSKQISKYINKYLKIN